MFQILGNTKLLVGLVSSKDKDLKDIEVIDLKSSLNKCQLLPNFPIALNGAFGGLGFRDNPLICGGTNGLSIYSECYSYEDKEWKKADPMAKYRSLPAFDPNSDGTGNIFVTGGCLFNMATNTSEVLTRSGWQSLIPAMPIALCAPCMVAINSTTFMVIGGRLMDAVSTKTYFINTVNNIWIEGPPLLFGRFKHSCSKIKKNSQSHQMNVIIAGGYYHDTYKLTNSVEIFNVETNQWSFGPALPFPMAGSQMVEDGNGGVVVVGGFQDDEELDTFFLLKHVEAQWIKMDFQLKTGRYYFTAFFIPDEITNCTYSSSLKEKRNKLNVP